MMHGNNQKYPTARDVGDKVNLELYVNGKNVFGQNVRGFLYNVVAFIDSANSLNRLPLPFPTLGANTLASREAYHFDGRPFVNNVEYRLKKGPSLYINTNHPRFFARRQGARLVEAVGLFPLLVKPETRNAETEIQHRILTVQK